MSMPTPVEIRPLPEEAEPVAGRAPTPMWLVGVLGCLFYVATMTLDRQAGGFHARVYTPYASLQKVEEANPKPATDPLFEKGRGIFLTYCASCHQADGLGSAIQAPPLAGSDWVLAEHPNRIIRIVLNGMAGPITVSGKSYTFNNVMLPWRDTLNDEQIAAVLTYIRMNKAWGNQATPVRPEQVAPIRKATAGRDTNWTQEELLKVALGEE